MNENTNFPEGSSNGMEPKIFHIKDGKPCPADIPTGNIAEYIKQFDGLSVKQFGTMEGGPIQSIFHAEDEINKLKQKIQFLEAMLTNIVNTVNVVFEGLNEAEGAIRQNYIISDCLMELISQLHSIPRVELDKRIESIIISKSKETKKWEKTSKQPGENLNPDSKIS